MRIPRSLKLAALALAGLVVLVFGALAILVHTVDLAPYVQMAAAKVREATGRELKIGKVSARVFPALAVVAEDVSLENAPWGSRREMVKAKRIEGEIALLPLLSRRLEITRFDAIEPDLLLEQDAKGVGNWVFKPAKPGAQQAPAPEGGSSFTADVHGLDIRRGVIAWRPAGAREPQRLVIDRARLDRPTLGSTLGVDVAASWREQPFTLKGSMGRITRILDKDDAWPVDLAFATAGATASVNGKVDWRTTVPKLDGTVKAEVRDAAGLSRLAGTRLDLPLPIVLSATARATADEYRVDPLTLGIGKGTVEGRIAAKTDGPRPFVAATLKSPLVDLSAGGKRAASATGKTGGGNGRVFSSAPLPLDALRTFDGTADVTIDRLILASGLPVESLRLQAALKDGRLNVHPAEALVGGGKVTAKVALDASRPKAATLAVNADGAGISAEEIAAAVGHAGTVSGGRTDFAASLAGPADSVARFMGGANGELRVTMGPARTSGAALDFGGDVFTKVADLANPSRRTEKAADISCAVVRLPVRNGVASAQRTIATETKRVNIVAAGTIDFRNETLDLAVRPTVNEGLGIGAATLAELVKVTGTLANPSVGIDTLGSAKTALSVGGAILTGGLSLLGEAAIKKGTNDPHPCQTALAGGNAPRAEAPQAKPAEKKEEPGFFGRLFK